MEPTKQLGYLLHHVVFVFDRQSDQILQERLGIGFSQFKIMMMLSWHDGIRQKQIAESLGQTEASISRQIKLMQAKGLVASRVNPSNRREHFTALTTRGERFSTEAFNILNSQHTNVFAGLSEKQQSQLSEMLDLMHTAICSQNKPGRCYL
jgi:DNA-binding MarR family transcriptional regulator